MYAVKKTNIYKKDLPVFINHYSARLFFKNRYKELFVLKKVYAENNVKFYVYHLVVDKDKYITSMCENSYVLVEISEYGYVFYK